MLEILDQIWKWLYFGAWILILIATPMVARKRGRSGVSWFFLSLFFSYLAILVLFALPDLFEEEGKQRKIADLERENRRLRFATDTAKATDAEPNLCEKCGHYSAAYKLCGYYQQNLTIRIRACPNFVQSA